MIWLKSEEELSNYPSYQGVSENVTDYQEYDSIPQGSEFPDSGGADFRGTDWIRECDGDVREKLAELEHQQWVEWSKDIADKEELSKERLDRWKGLWCDYKDLTEEKKDQDREWADKVLKIMKNKEISEE